MQDEIKNYKRVGFTLKPDAPELKRLFLDIKSKFENVGIEVLLAKKSAKMVGLDGVSFSKMCKRSDFLVSLGGDGTLLSLVRKSYKYDKPVVGINAGNLGFLADVKIDEVDSFLIQLQNGKCRIDNRLMVKAKILSGSKEIKFFAFNDVVVTRESVDKMANIEAYIDGEMFNRYVGDGLIVSTPTGSTAYNLSANGPIVYPLTEAFILTPICPHSLTQRPIVVPSNFVVTIKGTDEKLVVIVDGQDSYELNIDDTLVIERATKSAMFLHREDRNYFEVIRDKLSWGNK